MILLWSMLATTSAPSASMIPATPANARQLVDNDYYPLGALRESRNGVVDYRIVVNPTGRPQSCSIISGRFSDFNEATCAMFLTRSKFVPASDDEGRPIYSVYKNRQVWAIAGSGFEPPAVAPDIEVTLNRLPGVQQKKAIVGVVLLFDPSGAILKCRAEPIKKLAALDDLACQQAMSLSPQIPMVDGAGQPVRWLERVTVGFSVLLPSHRSDNADHCHRNIYSPSTTESRPAGGHHPAPLLATIPARTMPIADGPVLGDKSAGP